MIYDDLWIQVDFLRDVHVDGVVTQGRMDKNHDDKNQWVTTYHVRHKKDGQENFKTIQDGNNQPKVIHTRLFDLALKASLFYIGCFNIV